ncbi:hypothetical protein BDV93DRAFT_557142 [Ceratobasidium sp. AG-I]|nr:hypothetical protein BDV93DRAFT_557142 [Ceratobasidium sp. AG-I]
MDLDSSRRRRLRAGGEGAAPYRQDLFPALAFAADGTGLVPDLLGPTQTHRQSLMPQAVWDLGLGAGVLHPGPVHPPLSPSAVYDAPRPVFLLLSGVPPAPLRCIPKHDLRIVEVCADVVDDIDNAEADGVSDKRDVKDEASRLGCIEIVYRPIAAGTLRQKTKSIVTTRRAVREAAARRDMFRVARACVPCSGARMFLVRALARRLPLGLLSSIVHSRRPAARHHTFSRRPPHSLMGHSRPICSRASGASGCRLLLHATPAALRSRSKISCASSHVLSLFSIARSKTDVTRPRLFAKQPPVATRFVSPACAFLVRALGHRLPLGLLSSTVHSRRLAARLVTTRFLPPRPRSLMGHSCPMCSRASGASDFCPSRCDARSILVL